MSSKEGKSLFESEVKRPAAAVRANRNRGRGKGKISKPRVSVKPHISSTDSNDAFWTTLIKCNDADEFWSQMVEPKLKNDMKSEAMALIDQIKKTDFNDDPV
ncbi:hypothetical protein M9Y10_034563 [Tritrichomonas musculus]|uniref:Uncharacterized protein n=1 Tax=Tritrichomonas musculus TaxID=1915356 RepID=A0ABR2KF88_9EUKA